MTHCFCKITALIFFGFIHSFVSVSAQERAESLFDRDRNTSVTEREHPEYAPVAIQRGAFLFRPGLSLGFNRAINVFASSSDDESDIVLEIRPSLGVETTWSRHQLAAATSVTRRQFFEFSDESVWNWSLEGSGRLDIKRHTFFGSGLRYSSLTEARTEPGAASRTIKPIEYSRIETHLGGQHAVGRMMFRSELDFADYDYEDELLFRGGIADQDFRDYTRIEVMLRNDYAISPGTAVFGRLRFNERNYDLAPPIVPTRRDSSGYTIDGGADFDIRGIARGVFGLGYTKQDYDSPSLPVLSGISVDGLIEWFPTQLTTITVGASRDVREAPFAQSGGFFATQAGINVDHELRRNIIISTGFSVAEDDYPDITRTDRRSTFDAGVTYLMNRNLGIRLSWTHIDQERGGTDRGYTSSTFGVSLVRR